MKRIAATFLIATTLAASPALAAEPPATLAAPDEELVPLSDAELDAITAGSWGRWARTPLIRLVNSPINLALVIQINFGDNVVQNATVNAIQLILLTPQLRP
jgi:hypothetical protein